MVLFRRFFLKIVHEKFELIKIGITGIKLWFQKYIIGDMIRCSSFVLFKLTRFHKVYEALQNIYFTRL